MHTPLPEDRKARYGVGVLFFANGAIYANILPRLPEIKESLSLSDAQFGLGVAAMPVGALLAGLTAAPFIRRLGAGRTAVVMSIAAALGIVLAGSAGYWWVFALALLVTGAFDALMDVAMNSEALRVQERYGRSILNSFHAIWSIGAVAGGLMGGLAAGIGLPVGWHLALTGGLVAGSCLAVLPWLRARPHVIRESDDAGVRHPKTPGTPLPRLTLVLTFAALALVASSGTLVEDAGATWSALYLGRDLGASVSVAALGFVALQGMQFVGRMVGDRLVDRWGQRTVARAGGALVVLGMGLALAFPTVPGTIAGFGAAGFGVATLVPAAMHAADRLPGLKEGSGLSIISWLLRTGLLASPPVIGFIADATNLRTGLALVVVAGILVVALSGVLATRRPAQEK